MASDSYDIEFFFDPVCPFAWITSRWVEKVQAQRDYSVDWRFIPLRILNKDKDYATDFPPNYPFIHGAGLKMMRVAARARAEHGRQAMGGLYTAMGNNIWGRNPTDYPDGKVMANMGSVEMMTAVLTDAGLPTDLTDALDDTAWDAELEAEAETALERTGRDVGTPIISFHPPDGLSFFGPVISRVPNDDDAVELWDAVIKLASWPGFAEMKRSLREMPQLRSIVGDSPAAVVEEDWQGGSRRPDQ